jgi:hypothetical protein
MVGTAGFESDKKQSHGSFNCQVKVLSILLCFIRSKRSHERLLVPYREEECTLIRADYD